MSAINDGGPAFPVPMFTRQSDGQPMSAGDFFEGGNGLSLRDWFARNTPQDEVCEMTYRHLSLLAQERLAGIKKPEVDRGLKAEDAATRQIEVMMFHARVNAALRYISADSMLAARERKEEK